MFDLRRKCLKITMLLTFKILRHARNHCERFPKYGQTSFSGIAHLIGKPLPSQTDLIQHLHLNLGDKVDFIKSITNIKILLLTLTLQYINTFILVLSIFQGRSSRSDHSNLGRINNLVIYGQLLFFRVLVGPIIVRLRFFSDDQINPVLLPSPLFLEHLIKLMFTALVPSAIIV